MIAPNEGGDRFGHATQAMGLEMAAMICRWTEAMTTEPHALRGRGRLKRGIVGIALCCAAKEAGAIGFVHWRTGLHRVTKSGLARTNWP